MAKKNTPEKVTEKANTSAPKKVASVKVSAKKTVEVIVTAKKFGTYPKGTVLTMHESTAKGCVSSGVVEYK